MRGIISDKAQMTGRDAGTRQSGAALIVGLVLLTVMTVLAVSTMSTASLELLMAGNAQYKENAFQLADSTLERIWRDYRQGLANPPGGGNPVGNYQLLDAPGQPLGGEIIDEPGPNGGTINAEITAVGSTIPLRCLSSTDFREYHVQVQATAETDVRNARSTQSRGFAMCFLAPGAL